MQDTKNVWSPITSDKGRDGSDLLPFVYTSIFKGRLAEWLMQRLAKP